MGACDAGDLVAGLDNVACQTTEIHTSGRMEWRRHENSGASCLSQLGIKPQQLSPGNTLVLRQPTKHSMTTVTSIPVPVLNQKRYSPENLAHGMCNKNVCTATQVSGCPHEHADECTHPCLHAKTHGRHLSCTNGLSY